MMFPVRYDDIPYNQRWLVRKQYINHQLGKCYYCEEDIYSDPPVRITSKSINWGIFPPHFLDAPIHLQHNHKTGMTEGAVHSYCNAVMWQYEGR